uniref:RNA-directed RNA polymerase C-terminal domain-containing protein n=1 Tax=Riboviria sp. TaxID=2585031 RepID=A0A8K1U2H6_9VIRU|nr:MAG: hypothetical protein 2 [Riboviria sp.]
MDIIVEALRVEYQPARWRIPSDFLTFEHFRRVVKDMEMTSSPGYPYLLTTPTIGRYLGYDGDGGFDENRLRVVWREVQERIENKTSDPIRLFIKPEPHKSKKRDQKAWRLISSVSVLDQIIDHMLFDPMNDKIVLAHFDVVPQVGWCPIKGGWTHMPCSGLAMDKSGWDWTVRPWLLEIVLRLRGELCENVDAKWLELAKWRYGELFNQPFLVTSGGQLFRQRNPGVMKSGCVNTITDNSIMQDILNKVVELETGQCSSWMLTMGDDTLQSPPEDLGVYIQCLRKYCIVKDAKASVEFAGFRFDPEHVEPLYFGKHAFSLLHANQKDAPDYARAYALLYHKSRRSSLVRSLCEYLGYVPSESYLDGLWNFEA